MSYSGQISAGHNYYIVRAPEIKGYAPLAALDVSVPHALYQTASATYYPSDNSVYVTMESTRADNADCCFIRVLYGRQDQ